MTVPGATSGVAFRLLPPAASDFTLVVLGLWLVDLLDLHNPASILGAVMWLVGLLSILAVPEERFTSCGGSRPDSWSTGSWYCSCGLVCRARGHQPRRSGYCHRQRRGCPGYDQTDPQNVAMIGMLFVLVLYPVGFAAMLMNRFIRNPKPLFNIWREAGDVIRRVRTRS